MSTPNDGGPVHVVCSRCNSGFVGKHYNLRDRRCPQCKRAQQNAKNAENPDIIRQRARDRYEKNKSYWVRYAKALSSSPEYKQKRAARRKVATEIEAGRITRKPCEVCGGQKSEAHHVDYRQPLKVQWYCKRHHALADAMLAARTGGAK